MSIDVTHLGEVEWQGNTYDSILLCVDRLSGWIIARPTTKEGLTGEKAAHLLIDQSWGEMGIPSIITADLGSQFVSNFWKTLCARMGIRQAYSQAYHHQANGRAEVANRILKDTLRALLVDKGISWVEALPRALRIIHDTPDPQIGLSPYEIMFGRTRQLATLPWEPPHKSQEAEEFLADMYDLDQELAKHINDHHKKIENSRNKKRPQDPYVYKPNDMVWVFRPNETGGIKLDTRWHGPYRVLTRTGEHSYEVKTADTTPLDVHTSQLKPCHWEPLKGTYELLQIPPPDPQPQDQPQPTSPNSPQQEPD